MNGQIEMGDFSRGNEVWNNTTRQENVKFLHEHMELVEYSTVASPGYYSAAGSFQKENKCYWKTVFLPPIHFAKENWNKQKTTSTTTKVDFGIFGIYMEMELSIKILLQKIVNFVFSLFFQVKFLHRPCLPRNLYPRSINLSVPGYCVLERAV